MNGVRLIVFISICLLVACVKPLPETAEREAGAMTQSMTVQGQAVIKKGATLLARRQAFQDAISNVSVEMGHKFSAQSILGSTKVVDEWVADDKYHVQVLVLLSKDLQCSSPYRKRLLVTGFPIVTSGQVSANETQDLYSGIPREIMNVLVESGDFIGRNATHTVLYSQPDMAPDITNFDVYQDSIVVTMAQEQNAQFVLSGVIRDLEVESTEYTRGAGVFSQVKSMMRDFVARRGLAIDIYVHEGSSGALLFQHRYMDSVIGDVWIPSGYTVGSPRFKSTPTGHKISKIIQLASKDIQALFTCHPFSAKIIQVDSNKVYIAAGSQDKLKQGDRLVVYTVISTAGLSESVLIGVINIQSVQANSSVGKMEVVSDVRRVKAGDVVKSW